MLVQVRSTEYGVVRIGKMGNQLARVAIISLQARTGNTSRSDYRGWPVLLGVGAAGCCRFIIT